MADLVLLALGGVQHFVSESRTTADVAGASGVVQSLAECAAMKAGELLAASPEPFGLIIPGVDAVGNVRRGSTNKVAFLAPDGRGPELATVVADAVCRDWSARVGKVFPNGVVTPEMPDVSWVSVTGSADPEHYGELWERARSALVARRRARVFRRCRW